MITPFCTCNTIENYHLIIFQYFFFLRKKLSIVDKRDVCPYVRLSSVETISFRGNLISNRPIVLKFDLNVIYGVVHVWNVWFFEILIASCKFMQLTIYCKYLCVHVFKWSANPIWLKTDMHVHVCFTIMHVWIVDFCKITIGSGRLLQLAIFCK